MFFKKILFLSLLILLIAPGCIFSRLRTMYLYSLGSSHPIKNGKATVFIHGTTNIIPFIEPLLGGYVDTWIQDRVRALSDAWPLEFRQDSCYFLRWPGHFNINVRKQAAECLYKNICSHKGPLTIIAHSHGCSIALYLAELCQRYKNKTFKVDTLILLAPPVQEATAPLVKSKIFKRVFSFYSSTDFLQIIAPQRVFKTRGKKSRHVLCGSDRVFPESPNLIQARILIDHKNPSHIDFCYGFLQKLPSITAFLEKNTNRKKRHVILNIPTNAASPTFLQESECDQLYDVKSKRTRQKAGRPH